jgi:hypothetical protein
MSNKTTNAMSLKKYVMRRELINIDRIGASIFSSPGPAKSPVTWRRRCSEFRCQLDGWVILST